MRATGQLIPAMARSAGVRQHGPLTGPGNEDRFRHGNTIFILLAILVVVVLVAIFFSSLGEF